MLASVSRGSPSSPCGQCPEVSHFLDLTWVLAVPGGVPGPVAPSTVDFEFLYSGSLFGNEIEKKRSCCHLRHHRRLWQGRRPRGRDLWATVAGVPGLMPQKAKSGL